MSTFAPPNSDLDDVIDTSGFGVDDAQPKQGGAACSKAGMYHVHVKDIKKEGSMTAGEDGSFKSPCIRLDLEILAGTHPDQVGKTIYHRVYQAKAKREKDPNDPNGKKEITVGYGPLTDASREQYMRTAFQLGVMAEEELGKAKATVRWSLAPGRQCVVRVDEDTEDDYKKPGQNRTVYRINFGNFWSVTHPDVAEVPKDPEAMAMAGGPVSGVDLSDI